MTEHSSPIDRPVSFHRSVFFTSSGTLANIVILFLETMIAVRLLSTESYGTYVLLIAIVNFIVMAVDFGCKTSVTRFLVSNQAERDQQAAVTSSTLLFRLAVVAMVSAIIWVGQSLLVSFGVSGALLEYLLYVPWMILFASLDELFTGMLQGFQAFRSMAAAQVLRSVLRLGLTTGFIFILHLDVLGLIYSWIISFAVSSIFQFLAMPVSRRFVFRRLMLLEILRFGLPLQATRFLWFVFRRIDVLLLGTLIGPASVAYYEVASKIPEALQRLSDSYMAVYYPTTASLLTNGNQQRASWYLKRSLRLLAFAGALVALLSVLFGSEIIPLLFSSKYQDSAPVFGIMMIGLQMSFVVVTIGYTLTAAGFPARSLGVNVVKSALNVVGDLILIPILGFIGPALAGAIASYVANPIGVWLLRRSDIAIEVRSYVKQTLILLVCAGLFWWLQPSRIFDRTAILALFLLLSFALSAISVEDLSLVLPAGWLRRPLLRKEPLPHGQ